VMDRDEKGKPLQRPKVFDIDISVCMQCQICVEVCPFDAIKMDNDYEKSQYDRFDDLVEHLPQLLKSNEYYNKIKPTEAGAVDAKLKAEAEKKAKKAAPAAKPAAAAAPKPVAPGRPKPRGGARRKNGDPRRRTINPRKPQMAERLSLGGWGGGRSGRCCVSPRRRTFSRSPRRGNSASSRSRPSRGSA